MLLRDTNQARPADVTSGGPPSGANGRIRERSLPPHVGA